MTQRYKGQTGLNKTCDDAGTAEWWCPRYRNKGSLADFMGDTQVDWVETVAVDFAQWLNEASEHRASTGRTSCTTTILREIGPGVRVGYFVTAFIIVVIGSISVDDPPLFRYAIRNGSIETKYSDLTYGFALGLWMLDFAILCLSYFLIRYYATPSRVCSNGEWQVFQRVPTLMTREQQRSQRRGTRPSYGCGPFFFMAPTLCSECRDAHTDIAHGNTHNPYIAACSFCSRCSQCWRRSTT